ncbi:ComEA family DNA-binding protein [Amnibacterium endophyticum]|uniref:ComEA family DNA-binding protein n=1 Tax=Amnibacterium endophyticum TaxID=2109337 RepID=A0ABW4LF97_9MICO
MDPLQRRFASGPRRRLVAVVAVAGGAVVLAIAVALASAGAAGSETSVPAVAVERPPAPEPTPLLVHVSGAVRRPGLVSLPPGSRTIDAVAAAGGPAAGADQGAVNLAAPVVDGQQVVVPVRGAAPRTASGPGGAAAGAGAGTVALNSATAEQLETLPRIGPALAQRIVAYRTAHGPFRSVDELGEVGGIGPKTLAGLRDAVTL